MISIGIDMGTTTISAVAFETKEGPERGAGVCGGAGSGCGQSRDFCWETPCPGILREALTLPHNGFIRTPHQWERIQDPAKMMNQALRLLDQLLERYPQTASIGLTGQMHGIVYLDREGRCISPLYTWQDGRGDLPANGKPGEKTLAERLREQTGVSVFSGYGLVTNLSHQIRGTIPQGAAGICTIADCLGMLLTGRKRPLMHAGNGASLGFFEVREGCFREDILKSLGMDSALLPEITQDFASLGTYRGIPVSVSLGDSQASFLGSVGMQENTLLVNMGTGGQISLLSEEYFEAPGIEARPFVKGKYLLTGSSLCGGRAWAILEGFLRSYVREAGGADAPQYEIMERLALAELAQREAGRAAPMKVVTAFSGTRTDPGLRGSVTGISEDNFTPRGLACGVLEGMARELYDLYQMILAGTGIRAQRLVASGNGLRKNAALQKIFSQMFGARLSPAAYQEEAACGAAVGSVEQLKTAGGYDENRNGL